MRKDKIGLALLSVICALLSTNCMPRVERPSVPSGPPQRIVSLVPAVTEILFAIGAGEKLVGVTQHCYYPPQARTITSIGGFSGATMSVEQIRVLNPDLVFISEDMHGRILSLLDELQINSFAVEPRSFEEVFDTINMIGAVTGFQQSAQQLINGMKDKISLIEENIQGRQRPTVFWLLEENPLMTAGGGTFVSEAIDLGGGRNIFGDLREHWPLVSRELVLLREPEWVFIGDDIGNNVELQSSPFWQTINAVKDGRIAIINVDILYRYGPRLVDGVASIAKILHGLE